MGIHSCLLLLAFPVLIRSCSAATIYMTLIFQQRRTSVSLQPLHNDTGSNCCAFHDLISLTHGNIGQQSTRVTYSSPKYTPHLRRKAQIEFNIMPKAGNDHFCLNFLSAIKHTCCHECLYLFCQHFFNLHAVYAICNKLKDIEQLPHRSK